MSLELGMLFAVLLLALVSMALQFRGAPADAGTQQALGALQASAERQATQLSAVQGELKSELARHAGDHSKELSAFTLEQTRLLSEGQQGLQRGLLEQQAKAAAEALALREALGAQLSEARDRQQTYAEAATEQAAQLKRDLTELLTREAAETATKLEAQRAAQGDAYTKLMQALAQEAANHRDRQQAQAEAAAEQIALLKRDLTEQAVRAGAETTTRLEGQRAAQAEAQLKLMQALAEEMTKARDLLDAKLNEVREGNEKKLAEIQKTVNEQLAGAVEKQMNESFNRVIDQFTAIQAMMGNVQAVASQVGDLKRLFGNVKARGGWGEAQVRALLEDILPTGTWDANVKLREDSLDVVEFTVTMPSQGNAKAVMAVDAKFPTEDYDRLLLAAEAADSEGERSARVALERRIRDEAKKIASKYIVPPRTVEFAVMYLPNDGLYAEVARIPGLTDDIGRLHRVFVLGPALLPAMLRTIQLGHVTLALSENAEGVRDLLSATKAEMGKMEEVLGRLGNHVSTVSNTISQAQTRTRAINRKLKGVEVMAAPAAEALLELTSEDNPEEEEA